MVNEQQPEALRLADALAELDAQFSQPGLCGEAAAELRRLHAENEDFRATCDHLTRENAEQIGEIVALKEQRDELLGALKLALSSHGVMLMSDPPQDAWKARGVEDKALATIAKVGGEA